MKKNAILFKCHFLNDHIIEEYKRLASSCDPSLYDIVMLYDNTRGDFNPIKGVKYFLFSSSDFKEIGYSLMSSLSKSSVTEYMLTKNIQWFHADYPIFFFYKKHPEYKHYWQIEFDVRFTGRWNLFFSSVDKNDADFMATSIKSKKEYSDYNAWEAHNLKVDEGLLRQSYFPIVRFSNKALVLLDGEFKSGKCGYCEVIIPSLLNIHNYSLLDIDNKFYNNQTFTVTIPINYLLFNFLKLLPENKNKLFHPVKDGGLNLYIKKYLNIYRIVGKIGFFIKKNIPWLFKLLKPIFPNKQ